MRQCLATSNSAARWIFPLQRGEQAVLRELRGFASENRIYRSFLGMGYYDCMTPGVIQRNILENPGWYTQYTPYQAEIAQGRLEALVNFQTMVADLTGLPLANASLLDEATAAAEAMAMCLAISRGAGQDRKEFFVSQDCHPQTIAVIQTRAEPLGITLAYRKHEIDRFQQSATERACCCNIRRPMAMWATISALGRTGAQSRDAASSSQPICWR